MKYKISELNIFPADCSVLYIFQDGEEGKEEEEKENFGKLEFTLDYNFTDNQVLGANSLLFVIIY